MGRSGGANRLKKGQISRSSTRTRAKTDEYVPGPDHDDLVFKITEIWMENSRTIFNPESLEYVWGQWFGDDPENSGIAKRALEALLYQARNSAPDSAPLYRGQPFLHEHPNDRMRGWSSDLEVAGSFLDFIFEDDSDFRKCHLTSVVASADRYLAGEEETSMFANGGKLTTTVYVIDQPENGLSLNSDQFNDKRREVSLTRFEEGLTGGGIYSRDPDSKKWSLTDESRELEGLKKEAARLALESLGKEEVFKILGSKNYPHRINPETFSPEDISVHSLIFQITEKTPLKDIDALLERVGNQDKIDNWRQSVERIRSSIQSKETLYVPASNDCYLNENEVLVPPEATQRMRRVDVVLAENDHEASRLNKHVVQEKIKQAIARKEFIDPDQVPPGQKTLF